MMTQEQLLFFARCQELGIILNVIGMTEMVGRKDKSHGTRRKVVKSKPYARLDNQTYVGPVKHHRASVLAVVKSYGETARSSYNEFLYGPVRMSSATFACRNVVNEKHSLHIERKSF